MLPRLCNTTLLLRNIRISPAVLSQLAMQSSTPPSPSTAAQSPACKIEPSKPKIDAEPGKFTENTVVKTAGRKDAVTWSLKGQGIAVLKIDIPDVKENTLNEAVSEDLRKAFDAIEQNSSVRGVVLMSNKPNSFVAGADIGMLSRCNTADAAARISRDAKIHFDRMEGSKKPIVAAISGSCMGGGLEMALACHYRIALNSSKTQFALPEVMLGLLPGAGGTQRLPKLISLQNTLDMMLTGKTIRPDKAKKMGFVDQLVQPLGPGLTDPISGTHRYLEEVAISTCEQLAAGTLKVNRVRPRLERMQNALMTRWPLLDAVMMRMARGKVLKQTHGNYPAPLRILDVIRTGLVDGLQEGYEEETREFGNLTQTTESQALIGLFKGQTECKKNKYGEARKTERMAVIGAGLMGAGIANVSIDKGIETILVDTSQTALDRGLKQITTQMEGQLKRRKFTAAEHAVFLTKLKPVVNDYEKLREVDVVVEAVFEDVGLKHKIIQKLEQVVPSHCVIATNTSALPIRDIASAAQRPERVIGMHYFSPVDKMQLLEIIVSEKTSKEALAVAAKLGLAQKKLIVVVKDGPGFFVVRCLAPMLNEVVRLFQEGVSPQQVDKITTQFGFPVGMATLADEVGLDVGDHVAAFLSKSLGPRVQGGSPELLAELTRAGFKGKKSGAGIYTYSTEGSKKSKKLPNVKAQEILARYQLTPSEGASSVEDQQIRVVSRFVNEALICLEEGIITSPSDGDVASVFGLGFPPFWGGPFRFVDLYGAQKLVKQMERYGNIYTAVQFQPCQLLLDCAKSGRKFYPK
uniref:Trifunctional enzyme subunit alpha, mitochondrial n=1 Tax=Globodera pallida TaxID=36090 RepID=A0A183C806_GLOPA